MVKCIGKEEAKRQSVRRKWEMTGKIKVEREMKGKIDKKSYGKKIKEV